MSTTTAGQSLKLASRGHQAPGRGNLAANLLSCSLSLISICLTLFNLCLFIWIWSSLGSSTNSSPSRRSNEKPEGQDARWTVPLPASLDLFEQMKLLRDENKLVFADRLLARRQLQVQVIKRPNEGAAPLRLSSESEIRFKVNATSRHQSPSLVVSGPRQSLEFPGGLVVRSEGQTKPLLECQPKKARNNQRAGKPFCHLNARHLELARPGGVDFGALKSIQTSHLRTRRLHSALNKLQLMTSGRESGISFESRHDQVHLRALDLVTLGSRNTTVIIKAKTIKPGDLFEIWSERELARQHKLCVCLRAREDETNHQLGDEDSDPRRANNGRVFAIESHSRCAQFSETLCAASGP